MYEGEIEDLERVLDHIYSIREKAKDLIKGMYAMDEKITDNCLINDENPKKSDIEKIIDELEDNVSDYRNYVIPRLKEKIEG